MGVTGEEHSSPVNLQHMVCRLKKKFFGGGGSAGGCYLYRFLEMINTVLNVHRFLFLSFT